MIVAVGIELILACGKGLGVGHFLWYRFGLCVLELDMGIKHVHVWCYNSVK